MDPYRLLEAQHIKAIDHVRHFAERQRPRARTELEAILGRAGLPGSLADTVVDAVRTQSRVAIHFHPDRLYTGERTVAMGLLDHLPSTSQQYASPGGGAIKRLKSAIMWFRGTPARRVVYTLHHPPPPGGILRKGKR